MLAREPEFERPWQGQRQRITTSPVKYLFSSPRVLYTLKIMAYFHRPCESYFVETHDDHVRSYEAERRERKRQADLYTQSAIATELSQLVSEDYREDIVQHMEKMEVSSFIDYPASPELTSCVDGHPARCRLY